MKQKSGPDKAPAEQVLKDIRRQTRRQYSAEEKIRIVLDLRRWLITVLDRIASGIASRMMSVARSSTWRLSFLSYRRGSWRCTSPTRRSTSSRRRRSTGC